jgi:hypothetical protein
MAASPRSSKGLRLIVVSFMRGYFYWPAARDEASHFRVKPGRVRTREEF